MSVLGRFPGHVVIAMAPAALVSAVDGQHGAVVHAPAPQIGKAIQKAGGAGPLGGSDTANCDIFFNNRLNQSRFDSTPGVGF